MTMVIQSVLFLAGMGLCVQLVGALYGIIDRRGTLGTAYPKILRDILIWAVVIFTMAGVAGDSYRPAFLWGLAAFPVFHVGSFFATKRLMRWKARTSPME